VRFLLDDELLSGVHDATTLLRPQRAVRHVNEGDVSAAMRMMTYLCQVWGGQAQPIVPVTSLDVPRPYLDCLHGDQYDVVDWPGRDEPKLGLPDRVKQEPAWDYPAAIIAAHQRRSLIRTVEVTELEPGDPWAPIYAATLGVLPRELDEGLRRRAMLRDGLSFEEIVPVEYTGATGSLDDLLGRLGNAGKLSPRQLAGAWLAYGLAPDTTFLGDRQVLPAPNHERRAAGPNIIVAVSEGCVADLALLWNLRGAHGDQRAMPIGLPASQVTRTALATLQQPGIAVMFGMAGGPCRLTSVSVPAGELESLAAGTSAVVVPYEKLLTFGPAPGRHHSQVVTFSSGAAYLEAMTESDREVLAEARRLAYEPTLVLDVRVADSPLPADLTMRGGPIGPSFQAGAAQVPVRLGQFGNVQVRWPSSWTALEAVARTRGLRVRQSEAGQAASTLIGSLGSVDAIRWLAHRPLIDLLYRLAERTGMSWQKKQLNALRARLAEQDRPTDVLDETEEILSAPEHWVTPAGEGRALRFEDFRRALASDEAAARWVTWAERRHLLVRGVNIECPHCKASSWLPMASVPPPVGCPGCGRALETPYEPRQVPFAYRLGEPLRRVLETDSLGHVLALHWFTLLLGHRGLIGAHPGAEFITGEGAGQTTVGEADVLLLFADGSLVPVEVKRTAAGVDAATLDKLDRLASALNAPYDVVAVSQPARDCPDLPASIRQPAGRPRLLISDDQVLDRMVLWAAGADPFAWSPRTGASDAERAAAFTVGLKESDPDQPWDQVRYSLLE
jgi:hypothetical protein